MLSLGDTLLGIPRDELVAGLNLEGSLGEALLHGSGDLGALLSLTEHVERGEFRTVEGMLSHQGLTADALRAAQIEAFTWVHGLQQAPFDAA
jgi:EAL and modified HD-GYP domain-containing signal transduction protein